MKINTKEGFTLIELLVVISIIGLLSSIVLGSLGAARAKTRDSIRKQDLIQLRNALAIYYSTNGSYPKTTPPDPTTGMPPWYASDPADPHAFPVKSATGWIPNLVSSGAIGSLPADPIGGPTSDPTCPNSTYVRDFLYRSDGVNYKLVSYCGIEATPLISSSDPFYDPSSNNRIYAWMITSDPTVPSGGPSCGSSYLNNLSYPSCW